MNAKLLSFFLILISQCSLYPQWLVYDQVSCPNEIPSDQLGYYKTNTNEPVNWMGWSIEEDYPLGQSFTPKMNEVSFVQIYLWDEDRGNSQGSTVALNLRQDGIQGPILSSATPVFVTDAYFNTITFLFPNSLKVIPGVEYYFDLRLLSGDSCKTSAYDFGYFRGEMYKSGQSFGFDLWFREGVIVPEPSAVSLLLIGLTVLCIHQFLKPLLLYKRRTNNDL